MNSFSVCSSKTSDLLSSSKEQDAEFVQRPAAVTRNLEAPSDVNNFVQHELVSEHSRMIPKASEFIEGQRRLAGTAYAEQLILELNAASQINRGPEGVFDSSRLHLDMLLGRDESITFGDYLNFDSKF